MIFKSKTYIHLRNNSQCSLKRLNWRYCNMWYRFVFVAFDPNHMSCCKMTIQSKMSTQDLRWLQYDHKIFSNRKLTSAFVTTLSARQSAWTDATAICGTGSCSPLLTPTTCLAARWPSTPRCQYRTYNNLYLMTKWFFNRKLTSTFITIRSAP